MGIKVYNSNEEKYSELIKDLQNLPKENAPDDFEFRLMTRIENGNFQLTSEKNKEGFPVWIFAPATAIVLSAVVFIVIFNSVQFTDSGPVFPEPKLREEVTAGAGQTSKEYVAGKKVPGNESQPVKVIVEPNDVVVEKTIAPPQFATGKDVNVDRVLTQPGAKMQSTINAPNVLVGGSNDPYFEFDGFYTVKENEDSLKKMKSKIDSLKKIGKERLN